MDNTVAAFLDGVTPAKRARDARTLVELFQRVTGLEPELHGTIVGFGTYHYRYDSGREGDAAASAFAPRKAATSIYLPDGVGAHATALGQLGPHTTGVGCLYIKDLEQVDLAVLEGILAESFARVSAGSHYTQRAREGSEES
ncbi:DUF1801 domain-containing protein [Georgenia subflava]|uniref:DUF1801 domain-containing protein n=1 Tax=Georgenia subflava TaxID=1622177 RepID=A0A6N7EC63_9MICO|nr:DUF1801 domain-containing protein [Georgenia subflava]MPV35689.1 DUF1801 domain-containing protein [Georgenia subflava]